MTVFVRGCSIAQAEGSATSMNWRGLGISQRLLLILEETGQVIEHIYIAY